jgi:hypothetical protein
MTSFKIGNLHLHKTYITVDTVFEILTLSPFNIGPYADLLVTGTWASSIMHVMAGLGLIYFSNQTTVSSALKSSGMWHHMIWYVSTTVSEESFASNIRAQVWSVVARSWFHISCSSSSRHSLCSNSNLPVHNNILHYLRQPTFNNDRTWSLKYLKGV